MQKSRETGKIGRETAETVAARALEWLAGNPETLNGFLVMSGLAPAELMARAGDPRVLGAVLDYVLSEDNLVMAFCDAAGLAYTVPQAARAALPGGETWHWT